MEEQFQIIHYAMEQTEYYAMYIGDYICQITEYYAIGNEEIYNALWWHGVKGITEM